MSIQKNLLKVLVTEQHNNLWVLWYFIVLSTVKPVFYNHCDERPPAIQDHFSTNIDLDFYIFVPLIKDHLSYKSCRSMILLKWSMTGGLSSHWF